MKALNTDKTNNEIKFSLIIDTDKPEIHNKDLVREVNSWWEHPDEASTEHIKQLFKIDEKQSGLGFGLDFIEIKEGEHLLNSTFNRINENDITSVETAVFLLDSIYHTRLKSPLRVAAKIQELFERKDFLSKIEKPKEPREIIDCVNTIASIDKENGEGNNYIYSFATKFCNRINPAAFPIFDSYVAGLLYRYNKKDTFTENFTQASLGKYENFLNTYKKFKKEYQLDDFNFNFKEIDIFMWTYGKILSSKNSNSFYADKLQLSVQFFI